MRNKAYPYPEIVTGENWTVNELTDTYPAPCTDNLNRQMYVPLDKECLVCGINHSRMIRRHELGHAKWSPKTMGKLPPETRREAIEVCEEIRVNHMLERNNLALSEPTMCIEDIKLKTTKLLYEGSLAEIMLFSLASMWRVKHEDKNATESWKRFSYTYSLEYETIVEICNEMENNPEITELRKAEIAWVMKKTVHIFRRMTQNRGNIQQVVSYRKTQQVAKELSLMLNAFMDKPNREDVVKQPSQSNGNSGTEEDENQESESSESDASGNSDELEQRMRKKLIDQMNYTTTSGIGTWGEMEVHIPPLTVNLQGRLKNGRYYRPADFGYNPKYINRYCVDKKIFKQKQNVIGGTILIDASGSMDFNGIDILEIMQILPAVTIAMYNGSGNTGDLRIVAKNGRRVSEQYLDRYSGRGNVVDGPALDWLATMPARRIWVSDMHVFGAGRNDNAFNLLKYCYDMCTKHKIINLQDVSEVKEHALKLNVV